MVARTPIEALLRHLQRARRLPGPLLLIVIVCIAGGIPLHAHDPGLSSLEVRIDDTGFSAALAIAATDLAVFANGEDPSERVEALTRDAIRVSLNGRLLPVAIDAIAIEQGAARVQMHFESEPTASSSGSLAIASDVPSRLLPGHRQLLVVRIGGRTAAERLLDARSGPVTTELESGVGATARRVHHFIDLGFHHILDGHDHLVFLLGLLLAAATVRQLVVALTAFTAAHSVSLALVVAGGLHAPPHIVEPLIALSIGWIGLENLIRSVPHTGWKLVFAFGLIHGLGFAGALAELGIGTSAVETGTALISFNVGVEAGQLAVAAAMVPFVWFARSRPAVQAAFGPLCSLMIVAAGVYWLVERLA